MDSVDRTTALTRIFGSALDESCFMTSLPIFPVAPVIRIVCFFSLNLANFSIYLPLCLTFEISYQDNLLNTIDRYMLNASHSFQE